MNKLYVVSAVMLASIMLASAEGSNATVIKSSAMLRGVPVSGQMTGQVSAHTVPVENGGHINGVMQTQGVQGVAGQVVRMLPPIDQMTTGDPTIDAQLKALAIDRDNKIKAIEDDYIAKLKVIIGSHTLNHIEGVAKGDMGRIASSTVVRQYMEGRNIVESTTQSANVPAMVRSAENEMNRASVQIGQAQSQLQQSQPTGMGIINFFKGILGGGN